MKKLLLLIAVLISLTASAGHTLAFKSDLRLDNDKEVNLAEPKIFFFDDPKSETNFRSDFNGKPNGYIYTIGMDGFTDTLVVKYFKTSISDNVTSDWYAIISDNDSGYNVFKVSTNKKGKFQWNSNEYRYIIHFCRYEDISDELTAESTFFIK